MTSIVANAQQNDLIVLYASVSQGQKCEEGHFACPSGNCISSVWLCDGQKDCEDGADEFQCGKLAYLFDLFQSVGVFISCANLVNGLNILIHSNIKKEPNIM